MRRTVQLTLLVLAAVAGEASAQPGFPQPGSGQPGSGGNAQFRPGGFGPAMPPRDKDNDSRFRPYVGSPAPTNLMRTTSLPTGGVPRSGFSSASWTPPSSAGRGAGRWAAAAAGAAVVGGVAAAGSRKRKD